MRLSLHHRLLIAFVTSTLAVFGLVLALGMISARAFWLQLLGVAFSAVVITVISKKFSERVGLIVQAAERIARGELDKPLRVETELPEVNALSAKIDEMRESLLQRDQQIQRRNIELRDALHHLQQVNHGYLEMLSFVTHELKSPVASMYAAAISLQDGMVGDVGEPQRKLAGAIVRNCEYLEDMVKNYLDLSRIEKGELEIHPEEVDLLEEIVGPCVQQLTQQAENRHIQVACDVPSDVIVRADPEMIRIALTNYLSNAIKYGRENGRVEIRARDAGSQVRISVWNQGTGFDAAQREKLFRKFGRLSDLQTKRQKGSGLGLYLVREIVERHGGRVGASSESQHWAEFWLTLPISEQTKGILMSDLRKVLLIDDDVDLTETLKTVMVADGYTVDIANSGAEGLAKARTNTPEVIVLDVKMETLGEGFGVARELRNDDRTRSIPIIMLSSVNQENAGFRYDADEQWNPVDVFLDKPIKPARLIEEIKRLGAAKVR